MTRDLAVALVGVPEPSWVTVTLRHQLWVTGNLSNLVNGYFGVLYKKRHEGNYKATKRKK